MSLRSWEVFSACSWWLIRALTFVSLPSGVDQRDGVLLMWWVDLWGKYKDGSKVPCHKQVRKSWLKPWLRLFSHTLWIFLNFLRWFAIRWMQWYPASGGDKLVGSENSIGYQKTPWAYLRNRGYGLQELSSIQRCISYQAVLAVDLWPRLHFRLGSWRPSTFWTVIHWHTDMGALVAICQEFQSWVH